MRPPNGKRGRSRGRNKGGHHHHGGHHNNINRTLESNGPDVKIRGTAVHIHEKYLALARDAHSSGDRIAAENYLQHAEHYHRLLASMAPPGQPYQPGGQQQQGINGTHAEGDEEGAQGGQGGNFQGGYQGHEAGQGFAGQQAGGNPGYQGRDREFREGGGERREYRSESGNDMRREGGEARREFRDERPARDERPPREDRPREERQLRDERPPREDRAPREDHRGPREERAPRETREPRAQRADPPPAAPPKSDGEEALAFERRLNGRSRRVSAEDRNGRAITSLEREEAARAKPADPPEPAADDDADEVTA